MLEGEPHQMTHEFLELEPDELKQHSVNEVLYGEINVDLSLVDSILRKGQLEPIIINQDNVIISGQRRWLAIKKINTDKLKSVHVTDEEKETEAIGEHIHLKAKCQRIHFANELQEKMAIIEYNRRRQKRYSQLYNEIEMLHSIWDPIAEANRLANLKTLDVTKLSHRLKEAIKENKISQNEIYSDQTDEESAIDFRAQLDGETEIDYEFRFDYSLPDRTRERIAKALGLGLMAVGRLTKIGRLAKDQQNKTAIDAMQKLDCGELSLNGAYIICRLEQERLDSVLKNDTPHRNPRVFRVAGETLENIKAGTTPAKAWKEYQMKTAALDDDVFSVILIEPHIEGSVGDIYESLKKMRSLPIPAAPDAALFVIANVNTLKFCIELITNWWHWQHNFKIESFTPVITKQNECGEWFSSGYDILLLATKGTWCAPIPENRFKGDAINRDELHDAIRKMYPNIYSFYEITEKELERLGEKRSAYKQIEMTEQHKGWGEPLFLAPDLEPEPGVGSYTEPVQKEESHAPSPVMDNPSWMDDNEEV